MRLAAMTMKAGVLLKLLTAAFAPYIWPFMMVNLMECPEPDGLGTASANVHAFSWCATDGMDLNALS